MADEIALNKATSDAKRALLLLQDETLVRAFVQLEQTYIKAWRETGVNDTNARERLWQATQIVGKVRDHLSTVVQNGKLAQHELDQLTAKKRGLFRA